VVLAKESVYSDWTQFQADHFMPLLHEPDHVEALAPQWYKYSASMRGILAAPETSEQLIDVFLVKV
jgi:hypothetical protein